MGWPSCCMRSACSAFRYLAFSSGAQRLLRYRTSMAIMLQAFCMFCFQMFGIFVRSSVVAEVPTPWLCRCWHLLAEIRNGHKLQSSLVLRSHHIQNLQSLLLARGVCTNKYKNVLR